MANRFLSNIRINDAYTFPASDGNNGQAIITDGSGNLSFGDVLSDSEAASVIYRDNFTGDGTTVAFALQNSLSGEDQTFIYIDGVYQEKDTYSLSTNTITFTTAPASGDSVEVISISGVSIGPTIIYQDNFTGNGSTTDFTLAQSVDNEIKTMIYFNGVYQFKGTYSLNGDVITFATAPANGVEIEVITIASAAAEDFNQKLLFYGKANEAISKGDAVMFAGQEGDHFLFAKATQTAIAANHEYFIGLASQDLVTGEFGYVTEFGNVSAIDTSSYNAGDILWFDAGGTTAGALTTTEPAAPLVKIQVAAVIRSHQNEGVIFVRPTWYHELRELHDVNVTSIADKDILVWDNANGYWENTKALGDITATSLTVDGNTYVNSNSLRLTGSTNPTILVTDTTNSVSVGLQALDASTKIDSTHSFKIEIGNNIIQSVTSSGVEITGNLAVDTNTLYVDASNNNVGIGTNNPVNVSGYTSLTLNNATSGGIMYFQQSGVNKGYLYNSSSDMIFGSASGQLIFEAAASEAMRIDSSGNVGIGTTNGDIFGRFYTRSVGIDSPGITKIQIDGASYTGIDFGVNGTRNGEINNASNFEFSALDARAINFNTNGSERLRISANGEVSIGVNTALLTSGSRGNLTINGSAESILTLGIGGAWRSYYFVNSSATYLASSSGTPLIFEAGGTEKMRIDSSGNVGIGEASTRNARLLLRNAGSQGAPQLMLVDSDSSGQQGEIRFDDGKLIYEHWNGSSRSERIRITSTGGITFNYGVIFDETRFAGANTYSDPDPGVQRDIKSGQYGIAAASLSVSGSKNFTIPHPVKENYRLIHAAVESPQINNIYRGKVQLQNGVATVNLDEVSLMTEGTFVALNRDIHIYTSNESDWDAVRGKVENNILTIECQNSESTATVSWLVIGERQDEKIKSSFDTDENGRLIVESEIIEQNAQING